MRFRWRDAVSFEGKMGEAAAAAAETSSSFSILCLSSEIFALKPPRVGVGDSIRMMVDVVVADAKEVVEVADASPPEKAASASDASGENPDFADSKIPRRDDKTGDFVTGFREERATNVSTSSV